MFAWCTWYTELAHSAHSLMSSHTSLAQDLSLVINISIVIHERTSLSRFSSSTSTCPFLSSSFPSTSCTASCTLSSTTWSSWKACATPPTRGVTTPATSPPPSQVMSPTSWPSASSTTHRVPSPTFSRHRTRTWMTWHSASCSQRHTEDKPITANQKACQSVSCRRLLCSTDQENLMEKEMSTNQLVLVPQKHVQCSQQVFWKHPSWESGRWIKKPEERNSSNAQIRTLLDEQRQMIIAECCEEIGHHELQAAHAEEERRLLREELWRQKLEFHEVHQQNLKEMEKLRKFQSSTFDTIARRKLIEDQNTILELSGRIQELQNEVNCMNDSKDFQDAESVRSGNSHVTSRPVSFPHHPIPEGMLRHSFVSPCRKKGPPSIWDTHGISGNVLANPPASSSAPYPQELNQWNSSIEESLHTSTVEKSERPEQNRDLRCQSGPSDKDSVIFSGGDSSKNYGADQQRLQISDLHFDKFPTPATFACWKIRLKTEVCICSQFPTEAMQWIKEVELVDSVDELRSSSSTRGISMPNFYSMRGLLQHWRKSSIIPSSKEELVWRNKRPGSKTVSFAADRLLDLRLLSGHWEPWFCRELRRPIHYQSTKWWYSGIRF